MEASPPEGLSTLVVTFGPGPLGLGLKQGDDGVEVSSVDAGHQAEKQAVTVGSLVLKVADKSIVGLDMSEVINVIKSSGRPFTMLLRRHEIEGRLLA